MYQLNMSSSRENLNWIKAMEDVLNYRIKQYNGIMAYKIDGKRVNISFACENENKNKLNDVLKDTLVEMFSRVCKMDYIKRHLMLPLINKPSYKILLHTLVAFDRECEREIIESSFDIVNNMALDGIFTFKLNELKERWNDVCEITKENSMYLTDEMTFNELLRFLISAINPKINKLSISDNGQDYKLIGHIKDKAMEMNIGKDDLLFYLVDLAPVELEILGEFKDHRLYNQLKQLFDAKQSFIVSKN